MTDNSRQSYRRAGVGGGSERAPAAGEAGGGIAETVRTCVETLLTAVSSGGWRPPAHGGISGGIYDKCQRNFFYEYSNIDFSNRIVFGIRIFE